MKAVLDVSAAAAIALKQEGFEGARWAVTSCERILAPELFRIEVANAMWRQVAFQDLDKEHALELLETALHMVDEFVPSSENLSDAFFEAVNQKHPVYDMLYLTLARQNNAALISMDKKLTLMAAQLGITVYYDPDYMA